MWRRRRKEKSDANLTFTPRLKETTSLAPKTLLWYPTLLMSEHIPPRYFRWSGLQASCGTHYVARSTETGSSHTVAVGAIGTGAGLPAALAVVSRRTCLVAVESRPSCCTGALTWQRVAAGGERRRVSRAGQGAYLATTKRRFILTRHSAFPPPSGFWSKAHWWSTQDTHTDKDRFLCYVQILTLWK